jgi:SAM-dependent methyltransferase
MGTNEDYQKKIFSTQIEKEGIFKGDVTSKVLFRIVQDYIADDILDIGAGSGTLIKLLNSKSYTTKGVDLYPSTNDIQYGTITDLPFEDAGFNTIFCCDVIEHLVDAQINKGMMETARVLKKGGHFIITTPCNEDLKLNAVVCPECGHEFHRFGHHQSFNEERLKKILNEHGFKIRFMNIYALGAIAKVPFGRYLQFLFKRLNFEFIEKTFVIVAQKI